MLVLVISNLYPPEVLGGYELSCAQVVDALRQRGHRVVVLTTGAPATSSNERHDVRRVLYLSDIYRQVGGDPAYHRFVAHVAQVSCHFNVLQILGALEELHPDVIYPFNLLGLGIMGLIDTFNQTILPWVWHLGDAVPADACKDVSAVVANTFICGRKDFSGGCIISASNRIHREITEAGVHLGDDVQYIPYWGIVGPRPRGHGRQSDGTIRFVHAGTMGPHKGTDLIVEAAGHLARGGHTAFTVDFIGPGETAGFEERARAIGVDRHLHFLGPKAQSELYTMYPAYDCFLFPTWYREPFGIAPVEAATVGCPPIMTYGCGAAEWFVHGVHCLKIRRSEIELSDAMEKFMRDPDLREALSRRAAYLATTSLDFEHLLARIECVLEGKRRLIDWDAIDWADLRQLAYVKDRLALQRFVDGL